jgi:hypothetical protein
MAVARITAMLAIAFGAHSSWALSPPSVFAEIFPAENGVALNERQRQILANFACHAVAWGTPVIIIGHASSNERNPELLALRRAQLTRDILVRYGVAASQIWLDGRGDKQPVADNSTALGQARNRRIEFEAVGTYSDAAARKREGCSHVPRDKPSAASNPNAI